MVKSIWLIVFTCLIFTMPAKAINSIDPTGPWGEKAPVASKQKVKNKIPYLQAIFVRDDTHIAVLNDKEVREGDWVSSYKIRRITDNFVYFVRQGKEFRLALFDSNIKH